MRKTLKFGLWLALVASPAYCDQVLPPAPSSPLAPFYARVQGAFRAGSQPSDLDALRADYESRKGSWCSAASDAALCARQSAAIGSLLDGLREMRAVIGRLRVQTSVSPEDFRTLDEKIKALTIALAIAPQEAAALAATYMSEAAPPTLLQQDIVNNLNGAAGLINSNPGLNRYLRKVNEIQSAVSMGQWDAARELSDRLFDKPGFGQKLMLHRSVSVMASLAQKLNPFGNPDGNFVQDIKVVQKDLRSAPEDRGAPDFIARRDAIQRGLDKFAVPVPLTPRDAKTVDKARKLEQIGNMLINVGGVVPSLTTIALYFALGAVFLQALVFVGLCPTFGSAVWGAGASLENKVRGDWSVPASPSPAVRLPPTAGPGSGRS